MINNLGLSEHVKYLGWINEKEKDTLLRKTDIFVLPSYGEGMPMSILEPKLSDSEAEPHFMM